MDNPSDIAAALTVSHAFGKRHTISLVCLYYRFRELACVDAVKALRYLQKDLHDTIDHDNKKETAEVCYQRVYYI